MGTVQQAVLQHLYNVSCYVVPLCLMWRFDFACGDLTRKRCAGDAVSFPRPKPPPERGCIGYREGLHLSSLFLGMSVTGGHSK